MDILEFGIVSLLEGFESKRGEHNLDMRTKSW